MSREVRACFSEGSLGVGKNRPKCSGGEAVPGSPLSVAGSPCWGRAWLPPSHRRQHHRVAVLRGHRAVSLFFARRPVSGRPPGPRIQFPFFAAFYLHLREALLGPPTTTLPASILAGGVNTTRWDNCRRGVTESRDTQIARARGKQLRPYLRMPSFSISPR